MEEIQSWDIQEIKLKVSQCTGLVKGKSKRCQHFFEPARYTVHVNRSFLLLSSTEVATIVQNVPVQ